MRDDYKSVRSFINHERLITEFPLILLNYFVIYKTLWKLIFIPPSVLVKVSREPHRSSKDHGLHSTVINH